ncbi:MAG: FGGY family carbohydrate kinase, partial [Steroidobacteraceae bacterium]
AMAQSGDALFGTLDTWLLWKLTGGPRGGAHLTDVTNASRTQLMDLRSLEWDAELLEAFGIPRAMLPRIVPSSGLALEASASPLAGARLEALLGDQQAALVGEACFAPGHAKNTYGTGCFVLMNTGERIVRSRAGLVTTVAYQMGSSPARYALEGSIPVTGALVQWLRDNLGLIASSGQIEALAREAPDNGGVYFVPAFSGLYAPHWNAGARGTLIGLTQHSTRAHLARAVLESAAYQTVDILEAMERDGGSARSELRVDGGMAANELLMQFQADILGTPVVRPRVTETTSLGAAYAAGLAAGYWSSEEELTGHWAVGKRFTPAMDAEQRRRLLASWRKAVGRSLDWLD